MQDFVVTYPEAGRKLHLVGVQEPVDAALQGHRGHFTCKNGPRTDCSVAACYIAPHRYSGNKDAAISPQQREEVIHWLAELKHHFHVYPESLALAISILDRFLASVKAHPKYLRCIAISCFYHATKTIEEDEWVRGWSHSLEFHWQ
ncbi:cyclin-I isoform X2 [Dendropsophus ebraccatus]|uniref:cyclin-I isoform X2 n=1 Tax=Dendropsophus ebraccatus TaxID=150705 RepID=UPI0038318C80